jgi:hypothetical protein
MIDRMLLPGDGMVAAKHDLTCADLRHQVAQRLGIGADPEQIRHRFGGGNPNVRAGPEPLT